MKWRLKMYERIFGNSNRLKSAQASDQRDQKTELARREEAAERRLRALEIEANVLRRRAHANNKSS